MKNKHMIRTFAVLLAVMLCMTAFSTVAFASSEDTDSTSEAQTEPTDSADITGDDLSKLISALFGSVLGSTEKSGKTGTVTTGEPNVVKIFGTRNVPEKFLLSMAAGLELRSEHPLARAILQRAEKDHLSYATGTDFEAVPGKGLRGKVAGKVIAGGNADFIRETCALPDDLQQAGDEMSADGITPLYFSLAGKAAGVIGVSDVVKESSAAAIAQMQALGLTEAEIETLLRETAQQTPKKE